MNRNNKPLSLNYALRCIIITDGDFCKKPAKMSSHHEFKLISPHIMRM